MGLNFLTLSILAHVFFGLIAAYFIVQTIQAKRKQTFAGPPSGPNAPTHAIEHKVQMQKKQQTMSAPAPVKRITTTSNSRVALPAMPAMPALDTAVTPLAMAGMGGTGVGLGVGGGGGGDGGGGGGISLFGFRDSRGGALKGAFFDFKQTPDGRATPIAQDDKPGHLSPAASKAYEAAVAAFVQSGFNDSSLDGRYFKGPVPLYTTQILIPGMKASEGPKAFNLEDKVKPSRWIVHYKGAVIPPESGTYYFSGVCDDVLIVRINGNIVLDSGSIFPSGRKPARYYESDGLRIGSWFKGSGEGTPVNLEAGQTYPIDIVIGEWPGGNFMAWLQFRKDGTEYKKDSKGNPILPLFRLAASKPPAASGQHPVYDQEGPIWKGVSAPAAFP